MREHTTMGRKSLAVLTMLPALVLALSLVAAPAVAQDLDALRASGAVAERYDGYLQAQNSSAADAAKTINAQRKKVYEERAAAQGVPAAQVGRVYAGEIFKKAPAGTLFVQENGEVKKK